VTVPAHPDFGAPASPPDPLDDPDLGPAEPIARRLARSARAAGIRAAQAAPQAAVLAAAGFETVGDVPAWGYGLAGAGLTLAARTAAARQARLGHVSTHADALATVRADAAARGGGAFIGVNPGAGILHAPAETALLLIGPPRRGKTTSVINPSVLTAPGPVVSTSTKPDVLNVTAAARSRFGRVWHFGPAGEGEADLPPGVVPLRWSPLESARDWGRARRIAKAMVAASPATKGTKNESHWTSRAAALLSPFLHAAAIGRYSMRDVITWVLTADTKTAQGVLYGAKAAGSGDADKALLVLRGVEHAADQERQSIWSATADCIDVYTTEQALAVADAPNWDPRAFVESGDTVYITAPAEQQAAVAPLVVALIEAVRDAQYARHRQAVIDGRHPGAPVTLALDEVANVAPIDSLPALVSEGGGQGVHVIAAVQDLSQVRNRWGDQIADGFLSLFSHVLVLGGVRDTRTLEAVSVICGEFDRVQTTTSTSRTKNRGAFHVLHDSRALSTSTNETVSRQRNLPPGEVYALPHGEALYLSGSTWQTVELAAHYDHPRWTAALAAAPERIETWPEPQPVGEVDRDLAALLGAVEVYDDDTGEPLTPAAVAQREKAARAAAAHAAARGRHPGTRRPAHPGADQGAERGAGRDNAGGVR